MAVTRLQRKERKNKTRSKQRKATIKRLLAMPVIKNIDKIGEQPEKASTVE